MSEICRPAVLVNKSLAINNIRQAVEKAKRERVALRPHFKTHQSKEIGRWFRNEGIDRITVSSLSMASYFASDGWNDITVAIPVNLRELPEVRRLAKQITLNLFVADQEVVTVLGNESDIPLNIFAEIDTGQHRSGADPDDKERIDAITKTVKAYPQLHFAGFATHAGHSYGAEGNREMIKAIHRESITVLSRLKDHYLNEFPDLILSAGDTPTFSVAEGFNPLDEVRPGNFVFYDLSQVQIGSCTAGQIAVCMVCPVLSVNRERGEAIIYGGAVHFSKEFLMENGHVSYGRVIRKNDGNRDLPVEGMYIKSLSQEHGIVSMGSQGKDFLKPGDLITVLPVHSCLTCDLAGSYLTTEGDVIEKMNVK